MITIVNRHDGLTGYIGYLTNNLEIYLFVFHMKPMARGGWRVARKKVKT
jgi:hypothetical protein